MLSYNFFSRFVELKVAFSVIDKPTRIKGVCRRKSALGIELLFWVIKEKVVKNIPFFTFK
jgi:hypothetical protein